MKAIILAAGYATRLYPLTIDKPKCLLPVNGKPIIDTLTEKLVQVAEIDKLLVVTNSKFHAQLKNWGQESKAKLTIQIINDGTTSNETRLGAVGDLRFAIDQANVDDDLLVLASDNLFEEGLQDFTKFARSQKDAITIAVYDIGDPAKASKKFGVVETDKSGRVTSLEEKPEFPKTSLIGMGVYYFPKSSIALMREYLQSSQAQDAPGHYIHWLMTKAQIYAYTFKGLWYDIGDLKALEEAGRIFKHIS